MKKTRFETDPPSQEEWAAIVEWYKHQSKTWTVLSHVSQNAMVGICKSVWNINSQKYTQKILAFGLKKLNSKPK